MYEFTPGAGLRDATLGDGPRPTGTLLPTDRTLEIVRDLGWVL